MSDIKTLISAATKLDALGRYAEADAVDAMLVNMTRTSFNWPTKPNKPYKIWHDVTVPSKQPTQQMHDEMNIMLQDPRVMDEPRKPENLD